MDKSLFVMILRCLLQTDCNLDGKDGNGTALDGKLMNESDYGRNGGEVVNLVIAQMKTLLGRLFLGLFGCQ